MVILPDEGRAARNNDLFKKTHIDADLELGLFTNDPSTLSTSTVYTDLTAPVGTGYSAITLADASAAVDSYGVVTWGTQTFTVGTGGWDKDIQGYYIACSISGVKKILVIYVRDDGPVTSTEGRSIDIIAKLY